MVAEEVRARAKVLPMGKGLWDDDPWEIPGVTLQDALQVKITYGRTGKMRNRKLRTLAWIVEKDVLFLDELMGSMVPGSHLFYCLQLVCNEYDWKIARALDKQARGLRRAKHGSH